MMTENLQNRHIFAADDPEDSHIFERTPEDFSMDYHSMYLLTYDGEYLHSYWIYQKENAHSAMTVLYFHGAGGNISHRLEVLRLIYDELHCNILIIDYRGFGKSSGKPSEYGLYIDAQTAYDYLIYKEKILPEKILVLGTSLGASVAIQLVSDPLNQVNLAIFENAFISIPEMAKYFLTRGKSVLDLTKSTGFLYLFDSSMKVNRIECPCMYVVGLLDPLVPPWMSMTLSTQTQHARKCQLFQYPFGKHNDLPVMENYFENIQIFLEGLKQDEKS